MQKNQKILISAVVAAVLIGGVLLLKLSSKSSSNQSEVDNTLPQAEVIPTVDSSVKVTLETLDKRGEILLTIDGIPKGTETMEYELTYNTEGDVSQGALGTVTDIKRKSTYQKRICLCSESSGVKRYHKLSDNKIKVLLKFNMQSGPKKFEKEFEL